MSEQVTRPERFAVVDVFEGIEPDEIAAILGGAERIEFPAGTVVCREGDPTDAFYILEKGSCSVRKRVQGRDVEVARLEGKAAFGEMGLIAGRPRNATVVTCEDAVAWKISADRFAELCREGGHGVAQMILNVARLLAQRLDRLNGVCAELLDNRNNKPPERTAEDLARFRKKLYSEWAF